MDLLRENDQAAVRTITTIMMTVMKPTMTTAMMMEITVPTATMMRNEDPATRVGAAFQILRADLDIGLTVRL